MTPNRGCILTNTIQVFGILLDFPLPVDSYRVALCARASCLGCRLNG